MATSYSAPAAGITDMVYRKIMYAAWCRSYGRRDADFRYFNVEKRRKFQAFNCPPDPVVRIVQTAGIDPNMMAMVAQVCVDKGAQIVNINMDCQAKKFAKKWPILHC